MRQILVLDIACSVYRQSPLIRIYINDQLIDEFLTPNTHTFENISKTNFLENIQSMSQLIFRKTSLERLVDKKSFTKFYIIEDYNKNLKIKIDIKNNDNNYNNGFMTKSTLVRLDNLFIVPEKVLKNYNYYIKRYRFFSWKRSNTINEIKNFYKDRQKFFENLLKAQVGYSILGKDCSVVINTIKKHKWHVNTLGTGFWIQNPVRTGFWGSNYTEIIEYIANKYTSNENK